MWKFTTYNDDAKWWQKLTWPLARWAKNGGHVIPGLKKERNTLFLFIMHTPPAKWRIYGKSSALYINNYGTSYLPILSLTFLYGCDKWGWTYVRTLCSNSGTLHSCWIKACCRAYRRLQNSTQWYYILQIM